RPRGGAARRGGSSGGWKAQGFLVGAAVSGLPAPRGIGYRFPPVVLRLLALAPRNACLDLIAVRRRGPLRRGVRAGRAPHARSLPAEPHRHPRELELRRSRTRTGRGLARGA